MISLGQAHLEQQKYQRLCSCVIFTASPIPKKTGKRRWEDVKDLKVLRKVLLKNLYDKSSACDYSHCFIGIVAFLGSHIQLLA